MQKRFSKFLALLGLAVLTVGSSHLAADFKWSDAESLLKTTSVNQLVDQRRSRSIDIDAPQQRSKKEMNYSLDYAVRKVRREYSGKVISAKTQWRGNQAIHKVRVLTKDGRVRTITVSGTTGR